MNSQQVCNLCNENFLVSYIEHRFLKCSSCLENEYYSLSTTKQTNLELESKIKKLEDELLFIKESGKAQAEAKQIKNLGRQAFKRQLKFEENPYIKNSIEYDYWLIGWVEAENEQINLQTKASIIKTLEIVDHVQQLALGYNQDEIANKLDLINEILAPHVIY
jgi:hypothetical protein